MSNGSLAQMMIPEDLLVRRVERLLIPLDEAKWVFGGSAKLVDDLRAQKILCGKRYGKSLFFSSAHLADVAGRFFAGEFDIILNKGKL